MRFSHHSTFTSNKMSVLFYGIAVLLSLTIVDGKGCWAGQSPRGPECIYDAAYLGGPEFEITYHVNSNFTNICCQALQCKASSCDFVPVFCGQGLLSTDLLQWEAVGISVNPMMRCYGNPVENFYSYSVFVQQS